MKYGLLQDDRWCIFFKDEGRCDDDHKATTNINVVFRIRQAMSLCWPSNTYTVKEKENGASGN